MGLGQKTGATRGFGRRLLIAALLSSTVGAAMVAVQGEAHGQSAQQATFNIPPGSLSGALAAFGRQAGLQVTYLPEIAAGKRSPGVSGAAAPGAALARILQGTGLTHAFTGANTVTISDRVAAAHAPAAGAVDGLTLDPITVIAGGGSPGEEPYRTAAPTAYISGETIERFRGSSPADIFRGTPGVMSGEARNGAGSIDVNVRGMQGMGRVNVTVDGAENSLQVYQGYQGISNRTFVDPDLLGGVDITKGSDVASYGIAGTVAMRTLNPSDIVEDGKTFGVRLKGGFGSNTSTPQPGDKAGYLISNPLGSTNDPNSGYGVITPSGTGLDRPGLLKPTQGSASIVAAVKQEDFDFLVGYAYRDQGNYHAGKYGPHANPVRTGPQPYCYASGECPSYLLYRDYVVNTGIANYRPGEEVLNTQLQSQSWITKGTWRFGDGQSLQFGYTGFRSEAGDRLASALGSATGQAVQQAQTTGTKVDTGTLRYRLNPEGNDLLDLTANLWVTNLELRNPPRNAYGQRPPGVPADYRTGSDTVMWGGEVSNKSKFVTDYGALDFTYGLTYRNEDTKPSELTDTIEGWLNLRDAERQEAAGYAKLAYKPVDWLTLNAGLRYSQFWSHDRRTQANSPDQLNAKPDRHDGGFSPSVGVTVEPFDGTQFYVNYSNALRFPSLFESVSAFTIIPNPNLGPERSSNWELGMNVHRNGLFTDTDTGMLKLGYFNWNVKDYIARSFRSFQGDGYTWYGMQVYNIDRARFSGVELSGRYEVGDFAADFAANYYLNVEFCQLNGACDTKTMYGDYATNQVPPKYSLDLTLTQKFLEDRLTLGGRASYVGPRVIGHGQVTSQGLSQFISLVKWDPYTLVDVFAEYKLTANLTATARIENLFDRYYVDPLGLVTEPGPGRTFYGSLTAKF
ncbi:TonB-dependent receptor [Mesorhizobium sp. NZP2298]|uniref:TonB-dependent receptor n=1 Tax=Mesorhizobium sp. NZP2298 TaxID=2483403 RepID=UPI001598083C|nr:TonB-dependent receptor [Mesorhizobium sp. NZP2298]QKC95906.1 TonB-dependent receptor [Mesorhizobium sp. NZP2298]